jgi:hypothetical protein
MPLLSMVIILSPRSKSTLYTLPCPNVPVYCFAADLSVVKKIPPSLPMLNFFIFLLGDP